MLYSLSPLVLYSLSPLVLYSLSPLVLYSLSPLVLYSLSPLVLYSLSPLVLYSLSPLVLYSLSPLVLYSLSPLVLYSLSPLVLYCLSPLVLYCLSPLVLYCLSPLVLYCLIYPPQNKVGRLLGLSRCRHQQLAVILQGLQPALNIGRLVVDHSGADSSLGTQKRCSKLCNQFLFAIVCASERVVFKGLMASQTAFMAGSMGQLMEKG